VDLFALARPMLHRLDPERAHRLTLRALRLGLAPRIRHAPAPSLSQTVWGRRFPNPVGLSAGFDKDAEAVGPLLDMGFGFVEVGSITPRPQPGNPRPRVFRLAEDKGVINRLGFNSAGLDVAERNLKAFRARRVHGIVGVNLGKNKTSEDAAGDYELGVTRLAPLADYLVLNVSSPNTPGLRALQSRADLEALTSRVRAARDRLHFTDLPPILLKIAPDLTEEDMSDIAQVALGPSIDGLIISNTTIERPVSLCSPNAAEKGGLSGRPLFRMSTERLRYMYRLTGGQVPLIGVGGVESAETAIAKFRAGACLIELYTSLIYQGPTLITDVIQGLEQHLRAHDISRISDLIGRDT
jgi:dihydroorotate dehydrogenase